MCIGTRAFGERVGGPLALERVRAAVHGWQQFQDEGRKRVQEAHEFLAPVCSDPEGNGVRDDWVMVRVTAVGDGAALNTAGSLHCFVADRFGRANLAKLVAERVSGVLPLPGFQLPGRTIRWLNELRCPDTPGQWGHHYECHWHE